MLLKLSDEQIRQGADSLTNGKLTASQVEDLVSIFRGFLSELADNYPLKTTLEDLQDTDLPGTAAKLAACLALFRDIEFDNGGFAPTLANKTGFNVSIDIEEYKVFRYAFGLLWTLPASFDNKFLNNSRTRVSQQGNYSFRV